MLWKKTLRDIRENKGAYISCLVIIVMGLMIFTSFSLVLDDLKEAKDNFYTNQNFADGFITVKALPKSEVEKLHYIEGIDLIQGRLVKDVQVLYPGRDENTYLRLVSVDLDQEIILNDMFLNQGVGLTENRLNIWVDNMFFEANNLNLNDSLQVVVSGQVKDLNIVGFGQSPEFIYSLRSLADLYPDPTRFGIAFIPVGIMKTMFPEDNAFNDLVFTLEPGADFESVKSELESRLKPYGLMSIIHQDDQLSNQFVMQEIEGLEAMSTALPILFLSIAAMIMYIVLKRLIEQQRGQIGILKAVGYTKSEIMLHYTSYALIIGILGGILGAIAGILLSFPFIDLYGEFFNIPNLEGGFSLKYMLFSLLLALLFSLFAGYQGSKKALTLEPAEAMRPPAPVHGSKVFLEKITFFWKMLTMQGIMAARNISRNKGRTIFIFLGIMFCFSLAGFTWSMNDMIQKLMYDQFEKVEIYDAKVTLAEYANDRIVSRELSNAYGVTAVEPMAEIPVKLKNQWQQRDVLLLGLPAQSQFYNILDKNNHKVELPRHGILLSERLSILLDAPTGTMIKLESLLGDDSEDRFIKVIGTIPQYLGMNAYMDLSTLQDLLGHPGLATAFMLGIDSAGLELLKEDYRQSNVIGSIDDQKERLKNLHEMMELYGDMIYVYAIIGMVVGFAIIYSSSIITVSERNRELASMMVLGMTPKEVLSVITFEQWLIGFAGMLAGIPTSKILLTGMSDVMSSDMFTIPTDITTSAYMMAFAVTALSVWIAQRVAARKIRNLSLVEVLKSSE